MTAPPPSLAILFLPACIGAAVNLAETRRAQHDAGALLARHVAAALTGRAPESVVWARDGLLCKPRAELSSRPGGAIASLNLSYAQGLAVCAFQCEVSHRTGVDVITLSRAARAAPSAASLLGGIICEPFDDGMGDSYMTEGFSPEHFATRWTMLEAVLKLGGLGLSLEGAARSVMAEVRVVPLSHSEAQCLRIFTCPADAPGSLNHRIAAFASISIQSDLGSAVTRRLIARFESARASWQAITFAIELVGHEPIIASLAWDCSEL